MVREGARRQLGDGYVEGGRQRRLAAPLARHPGERAVGRERRGRAVLDDPARLEHDDPVGAAGEVERVRHEHGGATGGEAEQVVGEPGLGDGVEPRGRLVEQQHGRVAQQHAGDADPLALAAGQPDAVRPEQRSS